MTNATDTTTTTDTVRDAFISITIIDHTTGELFPLMLWEHGITNEKDLLPIVHERVTQICHQIGHADINVCMTYKL